MKNLIPKIQKNKVLGCLFGASIGDAMGAPTECRTTKQILDYFGDYVQDFRPSPQDTFGAGKEPGSCTDDFWQAHCLMLALIENDFEVTEKSVLSSLEKWYRHPDYSRFTGPTTRAAMAKLFDDEEMTEPVFSNGINYDSIVNGGNSKATNGGAMKIFPIGLMNPGDLNTTIQNAIKVVSMTHDNSLAVSGACAVAAAVGRASVDEATLEDTFDAGYYAACRGHEILESRMASAAGPLVSSRMKLAKEIGNRYSDWRQGIVELANVVGNGLHVSEAVPAVFGILAMKVEPMEMIYAAVNMGNDTDTIATMVGAIIGTLYGSQIFPESLLREVEKVNQLNFEVLANQWCGFENSVN